jgi:hypothetical protein
MSISSVSSSTPQYQVPTTPQAKADDERTESQSVRNRESETGRDAAVAVNSSNIVDVKA